MSADSGEVCARVGSRTLNERCDVLMCAFRTTDFRAHDGVQLLREKHIADNKCLNLDFVAAYPDTGIWPRHTKAATCSVQFHLFCGGGRRPLTLEMLVNTCTHKHTHTHTRTGHQTRIEAWSDIHARFKYTERKRNNIDISTHQDFR